MSVKAVRFMAINTDYMPFFLYFLYDKIAIKLKMQVSDSVDFLFGGTANFEIDLSISDFVFMNKKVELKLLIKFY